LIVFEQAEAEGPEPLVVVTVVVGQVSGGRARRRSRAVRKDLLAHALLAEPARK
jgi:hypothetical protein